MARRSIWRGAISFGLVVIPVRLYPATENKDLSFTTLHSTCNTRLRQKRFCPYHEQDVDQSEIVRAYEYGKDQYVVMDEEDFASVAVPSTHTIEINRFVQLPEIDPVYFERSYTLEPETVGVKPFYLLKHALQSSGRVAVAKVSLRQKEHLCCLRPYENGILMETMFYTDEIKATDELALPEEDVVFTDQEMSMAVMLIDQMTGEFDPSVHEDGYRLVLERIIETKLGTREPVIAAPAAPQGRVVDLMEALRASIAATKEERSLDDTLPADDGAVEAAVEPVAKARSRKRAAASKAELAK